MADKPIDTTDQQAVTPWFAWPARKAWEEVRVRLRSRDGNEWEEIASDFEYWMQSADGEMCDDVVAFQIIGETPLGLASVSSASAEPRKDTVAFVQDWLMNADYDPTQFDKGFAAAIDARHGFDDAALTAIAERFCAAPLPDTVCADLVAIKPMAGRSGTNLMTVAEAKAVLRSIFPEPVPATNQAGEVDGNDPRWVAKFKEGFNSAAPIATKPEGWHPMEWEGYVNGVQTRDDTTALATQPATSQEGEACGWCKDFPDSPNCDCAATPTPPTLSEDLRGLLETARDDLAFLLREVEAARPGSYRATGTIRDLDAALAQVKAS